MVISNTPCFGRACFSYKVIFHLGRTPHPSCYASHLLPLEKANFAPAKRAEAFSMLCFCRLDRIEIFWL